MALLTSLLLPLLLAPTSSSPHLASADADYQGGHNLIIFFVGNAINNCSDD